MKLWLQEGVWSSWQDIMENDGNFGGKAVVFPGDWQQILPVGCNPEIPEACI